jgi:predicted Zn finger-like uncharacterized protein
MIIECKQCGSKFRLDEGLLREEGSRVRCSVCKNVFKAYPKGEPSEEDGTRKAEDKTLGETATLETHQTPEEKRPEPPLEDTFEAELAKALQEESETKKLETFSPDQIPEEEEEDLRFDFEESVKHEPQPEPSPPSILQREMPKTAEEPAKPEKAVPKKPKRGGMTRWLTILVIIALLLTGGAAALLYFEPEQVPEPLKSFLGVAEKPEVKDPGVRRLSFRNVSGKFCQSTKAGNLFCIQGMVLNGYPSNRSFIRIKGSLLDDKGAVVKQKFTYAGNTFPESELKDMSLDQIREAMASRSGKGDSNVNVKPQASVPFMIVFEELPDNLSEFTVEAVSSAPGQ